MNTRTTSRPREKMKRTLEPAIHCRAVDIQGANS